MEGPSGTGWVEFGAITSASGKNVSKALEKYWLFSKPSIKVLASINSDQATHSIMACATIFSASNLIGPKQGWFKPKV